MRALAVLFILLFAAPADAKWLPANFTKGCTAVGDATLSGTVCIYSYDHDLSEFRFEGQLLAGSHTPGRFVTAQGLVSNENITEFGFCDDMSIPDSFCDDMTIYDLRVTVTISGVTYLVDGPNLSARVLGDTVSELLDNAISFSAKQAELYRATTEAPQYQQITTLVPHMSMTINIAHSSQLGSLTGQLRYDAVARTLVFTNSRGVRITATQGCTPNQWTSVRQRWVDVMGVVHDVELPIGFVAVNLNAAASKLTRFGINRALGIKEFFEEL